LLSQLNTEHFLLDLASALDDVPDLPGYKIQLIDERTLEVAVQREQSMNGLFECLTQLGIVVISMRNRQNRLEQLFVDLVTRSKKPEQDL
ncbi:MAG: ABC transporter ATP-binding protein, partial [Candidatus Thiodiazotropha sp. 4PDIVS1]